MPLIMFSFYLWVTLNTISLNTATLHNIEQIGNDVPEGGFDIPDSTVQFIEEVEIPALASGKLVEVNVQDFQTVDANAIIARIDDSELKDRQEVALVGRQLLSNKLQSDLSERIARLSMEEAKAKHDSNVNTNTSSPGSVPTMEIHRSMVALERAKLEMQRVKEQKDELRLEQSVQNSEIALLEYQIKQLSATSPVSGVVLKVDKQVGEWANVGETVATVARIDRLQIPVLLKESQILHRRAEGTSVVVHWQEDGVQHSLRGRIESVEPVLRRNDEYRAMVEVENRKLSSGWLLMSGRRVTVTVYPSTSPEVVDSPATARLLNKPGSQISRPLNR